MHCWSLRSVPTGPDGSATLVGLPCSLVDSTQSVLSAAALLMLLAPKYGHVNVIPLLGDLHWLRIPQRIEYKLATLVYRCLHG